MKSDVRWQVRGVRRQARETAREAARRSGMSVGQWLDSVIIDTAIDEGVAPQPHDAAPHRAAPAARRTAPGDFDPSYIERAEELRRMRGTLPAGPARWASDRTEDPRPPRPLHSVESRPYQPAPVLPAVDEGFAEVKDRLDDLKRQLESIARPQSAMPQPASHEDEAARQFAEVISKLDNKLDQLITDNNATKREIEQRMHGVKRAVADFDTESHRTRLPAAPATPLDQALLEIADRQRTLDEPPFETVAAAAPSSPAASHAPSDALPRAFTQEFSGLEQQLRQINSQIETLNRPCGLDKAVDTLRDDLAEIGVMLQEAMPRKAVEALESEMRKLADRIDQTRQTGADATSLAGLENGLAEVRDALRSLTPAESLAGLGEAVKALSQKVELIAGNSQDPAALKQLEGAIVAMRGIVTHVASNDALTNLTEEVRALSTKVDQATSSSGGSEMFAMLERRIGTLADALEARNRNGQDVPHELETVVAGLIDRIENIQVGGRDQTALSHLEDRIAKLVEKLDASDHRLNHLEAIERGLAELLIHLEHQRLPNAVRAAGGEPAPEVDALLRDVTGLKQMERKTQDSLESVHGALEDVVGRLATIETDFRDKIDHAVNTALASAPVAPLHGPLVGPAMAPAMPAAVALRAPAVFAPSEPTPPPQPKPTRSVPMQAAVAAPLPVAETVPHPAPTALAPAAEPFSPAPEPIEFAPEPPRPNPAPPVAAERRPIDPNLPPDHPLEPGAARGRSPADRIAASEAAFGAVKPPVIPDPAGKSNFIAAARRAAQAAASEPPARTGARTTDKAARVARPGKFLAPLRKHARALIIGFSVLAIVLGSLNIVKNWLASHEEEPATSTSTEVGPKPVEPAPAPRAATEAPATPVQPAADRQSSLPPAPSFPPPSGTLTPREVTGSIDPTAAIPSPAPAPAPAVAPAPSPAPTPSPAPAPAANARPSAPAPSTVATNESEKLPTGITGALRAAAAKGDAAAQFEVGLRFVDGRGVPQNLGLAAEWFERAAKQGSAPAQFRLGGLYEKGLGVKKNLETARRLYIQAGEAGNAKALHNLAVLYAEGMDGKPDYQSAAQWFRKAAAYGMSDSLYNLGVLYARGVGVEQNLAEAYRWFALAAREGDKESEKKRDDLASRLDPQSLKNARAVIDGFKPEAQPEAAITVKTPSGGWDAPTVSAPPAAPPAAATPPANKRRSSSSGPKMEAQMRLDLSTPRPGF